MENKSIMNVRLALAFAILCVGMSLSTPEAAARKHALLVGVHAYQHGPNSVFADLNAASDVAAIRQALIDKFGFSPADIVTLTSQQATTRDSLLAEFRRVLIDGTQPGDI